MYDTTSWDVPRRPALFTRVKAKVAVIKIRVISLVQKSNVQKNLAPDDHASSGDPIGLERLISRRRRYHPITQQASHQTQFDVGFELARRRLKSKR